MRRSTHHRHPTIAPWLWRFLRAATPERVEHQARALRALLAPALEHYAPIVRAAGAERLVHQRGTLYLYASEASWRGDARNTDIRRRNGVAIEDVIGPALRALEPDLAPQFTHARLMRANGHVSDPRKLVEALIGHAVGHGATLVRERAIDFQHRDGRVSAVVTDRGTIPPPAWCWPAVPGPSSWRRNWATGCRSIPSGAIT